MASKLISLFFPIVFMYSCASEPRQNSETSELKVENEAIEDIPLIEIKTPISGLDLFIDSMKTAGYLLDTNRIKQTMWSSMVRYPKTMHNGHQIILLPFPVDQYDHHFSNPKTYFFAHWNEQEQTFKNGNDYLLMTWEIDSSGMNNEQEIYKELQRFMENFPCYIFRSENTVFALSHRMSIASSDTRKLAEQLKKFIDKSAIIH